MHIVLQIADFGMARNLQESDYYTSHGGQIPVRWTAPEALHYKKYSTASDVWSFGCLMYEIWSLGHKPFEEYTNMEVSIYYNGLKQYCTTLSPITDSKASCHWLASCPTTWLSQENIPANDPVLVGYVLYMDNTIILSYLEH